MKALTLWQPWAAAIAHSSKRVENRGWKPWPSVIGQRIAIHASSRNLTQEELANVQVHPLFGPTLEYLHVRSAIVCTAVVTGYATSRAELPSHSQHGAWYVDGSVAWLLDRVWSLEEPVPCKGAHGLWDVPADVFRQLQEQGKV
ncbi:MAG: hypothetical protein KGN78_13245 [Actinomycetales bacterium]|nr:hypothetical protein [Actinomycetales bacterium]